MSSFKLLEFLKDVILLTLCPGFTSIIRIREHFCKTGGFTGTHTVLVFHIVFQCDLGMWTSLLVYPM